MIQPLIVDNADRVTVLLVAPYGGSDEFTCFRDPGNLVTIDIGEPLGERELHDGGGLQIGSLRTDPR